MTAGHTNTTVLGKMRKVATVAMLLNKILHKSIQKPIFLRKKSVKITKFSLFLLKNVNNQILSNKKNVR